nr:MAG TPA: hypothetical protein [Caudoviricetes sp.]
MYEDRGSYFMWRGCYRIKSECLCRWIIKAYYMLCFRIPQQ